MKEGANIDFSHLVIRDELNTTTESNNWWYGQIFVVSAIISVFVNTVLVIVFSKNMTFQEGFLNSYNGKSINIVLKKHSPVLKATKTNPEKLEFNNVNEKLTDPVIKSENKNLANNFLTKSPNDNIKPQLLPEFKIINNEIFGKSKYKNIFDPRVRKKPHENKHISRTFGERKQYLNNYTALDNSDYVSFNDKCFNVKSLDGGMRNQRVWITQCRGVKSTSEKMLDNVNQYVQERHGQ